LGRAAAPGGHLAFATLTAGTFAEWRAAHAALNLAAGVPDFATAATLADGWPAGGRGRLSVEPIAHAYPDGLAFLTVLRRTGTHLAAPGHRPLAPGALRQVLRRFAAGLTVTYEVAYGLFRTDGGPP
jgi:malonyl-CoA O-methyltransferase